MSRIKYKIKTNPQFIKTKLKKIQKLLTEAQQLNNKIRENTDYVTYDLGIKLEDCQDIINKIKLK